MKAIGIDLGGTTIKGVLVENNGHILKAMQMQTNEKDEKHWKKNIKTLVQTLKENHEPSEIAVGLSAPGLAGSNNDRIVLMPGRLNGLEQFVWSDFLATPTWVLNDAHAAMMAESAFGAGRRFSNIVMLTLGTGVGGGVMINGELHQGLLNRAGHAGHISLNADSDARDITNIPGSLEEAIGDCTIKQRSFGKFTSTSDLLLAVKNGDQLAIYTWLHSVKKLAVALCSLINILSPELIILGGGISRAGKDLFDPLAEFMNIFEWQHSDTRTPIVPAAFDEYSGAVGAAGFALKKSSKKL